MRLSFFVPLTVLLSGCAMETPYNDAYKAFKEAQEKESDKPNANKKALQTDTNH
jgi:hypothetical protein